MTTNQLSESEELDQVVNFLCGSTDLDGFWYGDDLTDKGIPKYWWRTRLVKAVEKFKADRDAYTASAVLEAERDMARHIARLAEMCAEPRDEELATLSKPEEKL